MTTEDLDLYQMLITTKEIFTQEEYDFLFNSDHEETRISTTQIAEGQYLNLKLQK